MEGLLCLRKNVIDSDLEGLNDTNHLDAHECILKGLHLVCLLLVKDCLQ